MGTFFEGGIFKPTLIGQFARGKASKKRRAREDAARDKLAAEKPLREAEARREQQRKALIGLNPTGTLGAGTPQTTRSKTLGV